MKSACEFALNFLQNGYLRFPQLLVVSPRAGGIIGGLLKQRSVIDFYVRFGETSVTKRHRGH